MTNSFPTRRSSDLTTPDQPEDATRLTAEAHGHKFTETEDGYQVHSGFTHVFDREGRWRANFHGLRFEPTNLVLFMNALLHETDKPHGHDEQGDRKIGRRGKSVTVRADLGSGGISTKK